MMSTNDFLAPKTLSVARDVSSTTTTLMKTAVADPKYMGFMTRSVRHITNKNPTVAISAAMSAIASLRSIVPPALLQNATAAYSAAHKLHVAEDLSAFNWALSTTITAGLGVAVVCHARKTPPTPPSLDVPRWRKLLHNIHFWLHQKLKSSANLRREIKNARRLLLERDSQPDPVTPQPAMTKDEVDDFNDARVSAVHLREELSRAQAETASLRQQLEPSAGSRNELKLAQAELIALRQELQARNNADADLDELNCLRNELAAAKTAVGGTQSELNRVHEEVANLRDEVKQHEELQQLQAEELKDARQVQEHLQKRLNWETGDRKDTEEQLARDEALMWSKFVEAITPKPDGRKDLGTKASPPPSEPDKPTSNTSKLSSMKDIYGRTVSTPILSTPDTNPTPSSNKANGRRPDCTASLYRKLDVLKCLVSSATSSASSKRSRDYDDVQEIPIPFKKPRLAHKSNSIFTPGGRPSIKLEIPGLRPAEAGLTYGPSHDSTMTTSGRRETAMRIVKVETLAAAVSDNTARSCRRRRD